MCGVPEDLRPGVLFDVDGTLIDSNYLHTIAWSRAFRDAGEHVSMNAVHRLIGMGGDQLVPELLGHDSPVATAARPGHYQDLIGEAKPFDGAAELLRELHANGVVVVLATSAPDDELATLLRVLDAGDAIDDQTTADQVKSSKPSGEVFVRAMRNASIDPARALAVGDSVWDVRAARAAGIGCVAVETGGFSRHELSEAGAVFVYRDVREMLKQLRTGPIAALLP
jgi:HAD superfamily hydrolase (TIGR01509 family)